MASPDRFSGATVISTKALHISTLNPSIAVCAISANGPGYTVIFPFEVKNVEGSPVTCVTAMNGDLVKFAVASYANTHE